MKNVVFGLIVVLLLGFGNAAVAQNKPVDSTRNHQEFLRCLELQSNRLWRADRYMGSFALRLSAALVVATCSNKVERELCLFTHAQSYVAFHKCLVRELDKINLRFSFLTNQEEELADARLKAWTENAVEREKQRCDLENAQAVLKARNYSVKLFKLYCDALTMKMVNYQYDFLLMFEPP